MKVDLDNPLVVLTFDRQHQLTCLALSFLLFAWTAHETFLLFSEGSLSFAVTSYRSGFVIPLLSVFLAYFSLQYFLRATVSRQAVRVTDTGIWVNSGLFGRMYHWHKIDDVQLFKVTENFQTSDPFANAHLRAEKQGRRVFKFMISHTDWQQHPLESVLKRFTSFSTVATKPEITAEPNPNTRTAATRKQATGQKRKPAYGQRKRHY